MGAEKHTFLLVFRGLGVVSLGMRVLYMVLAQIFLQGLEVIAILRLKRFRLFSETAVRSTQYAVCSMQ